MSKHKKQKPAFHTNQNDMLDDLDSETIEREAHIRNISKAVQGKPTSEKARSIEIISQLVRRQKNGFNPT